MKNIVAIVILCLLISSCSPVPVSTGNAGGVNPTVIPSSRDNVATPTVSSTAEPNVTLPAPHPNQPAKVPNFDHIVLIVLENRGYQEVLSGQSMPYLNSLAKQNVLLSNDFAVTHPSLPNYIAVVSGSTQNITEDCTNCFVDQPNLADLIESSGRTWKTYQEDMPSPCYVGNAKPYFQKHNPFIYFNSIRLNPERCQRSIVPLTSLDADLASNKLPSFSFIMPNICNSGHDCPPETADSWVKGMVTKLQTSPALGEKSLIIVTFDEGDDKSTTSCCGMGSKAGGQIFTVLVSPLAKPGFNDQTAYSHYSLLKTIMTAWNLPDLGNTKLPGTQPIQAPWNEQALQDAQIFVPDNKSGTVSSAQAAPAQPKITIESCSKGSPASGKYNINLCLVNPTAQATISGDTTVTADLNLTGPRSAVQRVVFYLDGNYLISDYQSPYSFILPSAKWPDGSHNLTVEAQMRDTYVSPQAGQVINFKNGTGSNPAQNTTQFQPTSGSIPAPGAPFIIAAVGDGASGEASAGKVSDLIASLNPNMFLFLGDVYEQGSQTEFFNWYGNASGNFGRFRSITNPTIGNHEYLTNGAAGYFDYWGNIPDYYSYDAAGWHFISLNSNGSQEPVGPNSAQYHWLAQDLAKNSQTCTIAYYHHPFFDIGPEGSTAEIADIWKLLAQNGVSIVLNGHDHDYQRWVPLDGNGQPSSTGITEFVIGGGGHGLQTFKNTDNRVAFSIDTNPAAFGAMQLQLNPDGAVFGYHNLNGEIIDSGVIPCSKQGLDIKPPSAPANLTASAASFTEVDLGWDASTDNTGVSGYVLYRNGSQISRLPAAIHSYRDTTTQPLTTYNYSLVAYDPAGNNSSGSNPATITTPDVPSNLTFLPDADTYVSAANTTNNYGSAAALRVDGSPEVYSYLRFDIHGLGGKSIAHARLNIFANNGSGKNISIFAIPDNSWQENTLTFSTLPTLGQSIAISNPINKGGGWIVIDISQYITGEGQFSIRIGSTGSTAISFPSRESGGNAPYLQVDLQ